MTRRFTLALALAVALASAGMAPVRAAEGDAPTEWRLIGLDGKPFAAEATLVFQADGTVTGRAPCNRWFGTNAADLPAISLSGIGATKMACDQLAEEALFFQALQLMATSETTKAGTLVLRGPEGRVMEFAPMPVCTTCTE